MLCYSHIINAHIYSTTGIQALYFTFQSVALFAVQGASLIQMPGYHKDGTSSEYNSISIPLNSAGKHFYGQGKPVAFSRSSP